MVEQPKAWVVEHHVVAHRSFEEVGAHLEALSTGECLDLLRRGGLGRVAFAAGP